jgi:hypothetical protein
LYLGGVALAATCPAMPPGISLLRETFPPSVEPVELILDYAWTTADASAALPSIVLRCGRAALAAGTAFCAATGGWGELTWPRVSHWGPEKLLCYALVSNAGLAAAGLLCGGLVLGAASRPCRRSPAVGLSLWACAAMVVLFGRGHA